MSSAGSRSCGSGRGLSGVCAGPVPASVRSDFVRKVYGILLAQMLATTAVVSVCTLSAAVRGAIIGLVATRPSLMQFLLCVLTAASLVMLTCVKDKFPLNFGCLGVFTMSMALDVGLVCAFYYEMGLGMAILQSFALTAFIFGTLTVYAHASKKNFSYMRSFLACGLTGMLGVGFLMVFFPQLNSGASGLIHAFCGAMLFAGYTVFDTWRLEQVFGCDDYILAAIDLYLDIINMFLYI